MSDPLSVSASIAGLIGLAAQVTTVLKNYIEKVKSAHEDAKRLLRELLALSSVLDQIRDLLCGEDALLKGSSFSDTSLLISVLGSTNYHVDKLYKKLSKFSTPNSNKLVDIWDRLTWPLTNDDYEKSVADLHRLTQLFHASLTASNCTWLSETHSNVMKKLQENHNELQTTITTLQKMAISPPKAVLDQLTDIKGLLATVGDVSESITEIKNISLGLQRLERKFDEGELDKLMHWMSPIEPRVRHKEMAQRRLKNTGDWFIEMADFQNWKGASDCPGGQIFGCYGKPGAGKSIICSLVIDHLLAERHANSCVIWLYCDYQNENQQTAIYMTAALLKQLILANPGASDTIIQALRDIKGSLNKSLDLNKLCELLVESLQQFSKVYICIDALDECQKDRVSFLISLDGILNHPALKSSLKLFLTGRPPMESVVEDNFVGCELHAMTLTANTSDIIKYIDNQVKSTERDGIVMGEDFLQALKKTIISTADGMFLLPTLQIQHILEKTTLRDRREAFNTMPKGLNAAFQDTLRRIQNQPEQKGKQALDAIKWVFLAERQLTVKELCCALSVRVGDKQFDEEGLPTLKSVLESCLGLIIVDQATSLVRLVHKSLQDFLEDEFNKREIFLNGHQDIALTCLTYMNFEYESHQAEHKFTLADYAIQNWGHHIRKSQPDYSPDWAKITASFRDCARIAHVFYPSNSGLIQRPFSDSDLIYIPIFFGLTDLAQYMFENFDINANHCLRILLTDNDAAVFARRLRRPRHDAATPIMVAIQKNRVEIVRMLLDKGADIISPPYCEEVSPLCYAVEMGHLEIVRILLEQGADPNRFSYTPELCAIMLAIKLGFDDILRLLLENGTKLSPPSAYGVPKPLQMAAWLGRLTAVNILLDKGVHIESGLDGWLFKSPLALAAEGGHIEVARLLFDRGADINSEEGQPPLISASYNGHTEIVKFLLDKGARMEALGRNNSSTALLKAVAGNHIEVVELLLDKGANILAKSSFDETALSLAATKGNTAIVQLLLNRGIDIHLKDRHGKTAVFHAAWYDHRDTVQILLANGANMDFEPDDFPHHRDKVIKMMENYGPPTKKDSTN
ncbi:hypothetical protein BZA77DRAFT_274893 [Pyronema omphalodes]|nr:hypothetical protein BZA77DRAFT_274893 [Pyronema omphalodes]